MDKYFWISWKIKMWFLPILAIVGAVSSIGSFVVIALGHDLHFMDYIEFGSLLLVSLFFAWHWLSELRAYRRGMKNPRVRPFLTEWTRK